MALRAAAPRCVLVGFRVPRRRFCPFRNAQDKKCCMSRVIANFIPSCSENSEPNSVWCTVAPQEVDVKCRGTKLSGRKLMLLKQWDETVYPAIPPTPVKQGKGGSSAPTWFRCWG